MAKFLSVKEAQAELLVSAPTIARWLKAGKLKSIRIGGRRLIPAEAIEGFVRQAMAGEAKAEK